MVDSSRDGTLGDRTGQDGNRRNGHEPTASIFAQDPTQGAPRPQPLHW